MDIVPAIEETTAAGFISSLNKIASFAKKIHVDFNDGSFQGVVTVKPEDISEFIVGPSTPLRQVYTEPSRSAQDKSLRTSSLELEAHLMVAKPFDFVPKLKEIGFKKFVVQWEGENNVRDDLEALVAEGVLAGVAVAPETIISDIEPILEMVDSVTIMTVVPGKQGQEFLGENLKKIQELHEGNFQGEIEVDGGVNDEDIRKIISYQPDTLIVGSYIVKSSNPQVAYESLLRLIS